ncbi:MAG TPA: iron-only hydrogenase system regulator [Clostridia bacterium]|nr:iron-only hydrogenase system regulator [Clostridia bacterium]
MAKRLGFIGIVVERREQAPRVNALLSEYGDMILGRIGVPSHEHNMAVIGLVVEGSNERIGALTGKLGNLPGIVVKSALTGKTLNNEPTQKDGEET